MRLLALTMAVALVPLARPQSPADVDRAALQYLQQKKVPGCSVAIVKDGTVTYSKGYGLANLETDAPATAETVYRIGSITKTFTAALVMMQVEKGTIKLDDPIRKHLPELPEAFEKVTVRQLLNHTSGIASYTDLTEFAGVMRNVGSAKAMIDMSAKAKPNFAPGEGWKYNNTGYIVLGELVAKLEGKPWAEAVQERIAAPLGLTNTRAIDLSRIVKNRAAGYVAGPQGPLNAPYLDMSWPGSAGVMESTVLDLAKFDAALGSRLLKPETITTMTTPTGVSKNYGLGWGVSEVAGLKVVSHGGSIPGFIGYITRVPSKRTTVIVLTNSNVADAGTLAKQILGMAVPEVAPKAAAVADDDAAMTTFLKGKMERLLKGELTSEELTPEFAKILTPELVQDTKKTLGAIGPLTKFDLIETKKVGDNVVRSYVIDLGGNALTATFTVTADKKIAGLVIKA
ncbi:MAG: serine hydrolase domain-containing protein [Fimbriimonas sp.]